MTNGVNKLRKGLAEACTDSHHPRMDDEQNLHMELILAAPMQSVYIALTTAKGLKAWWTDHAEVAPDVGGVHRFKFPNVGFDVQMEIVEHTPFSRVHWRCVDCQHPEASGWSDLSDWVDTELLFVIHPAGAGETQLYVAHQGMGPNKESHDKTVQGWQHYLEKSLRDYLEDGEGDPHR